MRFKTIIIISTIIGIATFVRIWQLQSVPAGLNVDEVSEGYNAYSLLETGTDRYGMAWPITFKSYGSYQPPVYTYLTVAAIYFLGNTVLAVKVVSLISGVLVAVFTFLIICEFYSNNNRMLAYAAALIIAISPWAIFFSRVGTEASVSLALFVVGFYLAFKSLRHPELFPLFGFVVGLSTHAYYSERITSTAFILGFTFAYRKIFLRERKWLILGVFVFVATQIPHLLILGTGAFTRRLEQVTYFSNGFFEANGGNLKMWPFGRWLFITREFASQYLAYFSPRNLFFHPDDQLSRSIPDLSVFYRWMILPYAVGLASFLRAKKDKFTTIFLFTMFIAPVPAALSTDPFYTLRTLVYLWSASVVIAVGSLAIILRIRYQKLRALTVLFAVSFSLFVFYVSYFGLYKHERGETVGYSNFELIRITEERRGRRFVIDLSRDVGIGVRFAYFREYDPGLFQKNEGAPFLETYYSSVDYEQSYNIDNIEIRVIDWEKDVFVDQILVGDLLAISEGQVEEHKLELEFEIRDLTGDVVFKGYATSPVEKCLSEKVRSKLCEEII